MIFPVLKSPLIVQVGDMIRFDASQTVTNGADTITKLEIKIGENAFIDITNADYKQLDWVFAAAGEFVATLRVNEDDENLKTQTVTVITAAQDKLFSSDADILSIETELSRMMPIGYSSFNHKHREAQVKIIEELNTRGIRDKDGEEITKDNIAITRELKQWSKYFALHLIYFDMTVQIDSIFERKAAKYLSEAKTASMARQFVTIDGDGTGPDDAEKEPLAFSSARLVRR